MVDVSCRSPVGDDYTLQDVQVFTGCYVRIGEVRAEGAQCVGHFTPTERQEHVVEQNTRLRARQMSSVSEQRFGHTGGATLSLWDGTWLTLPAGKQAYVPGPVLVNTAPGSQMGNVARSVEATRQQCPTGS